MYKNTATDTPKDQEIAEEDGRHLQNTNFLLLSHVTHHSCGRLQQAWLKISVTVPPKSNHTRRTIEPSCSISGSLPKGLRTNTAQRSSHIHIYCSTAYGRQAIDKLIRNMWSINNRVLSAIEKNKSMLVVWRKDATEDHIKQNKQMQKGKFNIFLTCK